MIHVLDWHKPAELSCAALGPCGQWFIATPDGRAWWEGLSTEGFLTGGSDDLEQIAAEEHRAEHSHDVDPEYLERNGLLGGGGYASVWLATDTRTGRQRH